MSSKVLVANLSVSKFRGLYFMTIISPQGPTLLKSEVLPRPLCCVLLYEIHSTEQCHLPASDRVREVN